MGLKTVVMHEPVKDASALAPYVAKIGLYSLTVHDPRDVVTTLDYALKLGSGAFAHQTAGFFGGSEAPLTEAQIRSRGLRRAPEVVRWAQSYEHYHEKLPPLLFKRLKELPWSAPDREALSRGGGRIRAV